MQIYKSYALYAALKTKNRMSKDLKISKNEKKNNKLLKLSKLELTETCNFIPKYFNLSN